MFGLKRKKAAPANDEAADLDEAGDKEPIKETEKPKGKAKEKEKAAEKDADKGKIKDKDKDSGDSDDGKSEKPASKGGRSRGILGLILGFLVLTMIAGGAGAGAGMFLASSIEQTVAARQEAATNVEKTKPTVVIKYSGDRVIQKIEAIVTNLASPADTWIRLETAIVFTNGAIADPHAAAGEIRQDIIAYCRTLSLDQLQGPSALQHLREDLSERASLRTNGAASELVIETMVVQ